MKITTKNRRWITPVLAGALLIGSAGAAFTQTSNLFLSSFDSGTQGVTPGSCGVNYGPGTGVWDGTQDNSGNGGGSLHVTANFATDQDTPTFEYICLPGENPWWRQPTVINFSEYKSLQFDIKWDNSSGLTVDLFNNLSPWPANLLQSWAASDYLAGSYVGMQVLLVGTPAGSAGPVLTNLVVPAAASNGWVHITIPIDPSQTGIDGAVGIAFKKWVHQQWGLAGPVTASFWIDNVMLEGTAAPPPPPTINPLVKASQGLNVFASTPGNWDRESVELVQSNGLSWVGQATEANPVTYSFTITSFPSAPATYGCEAYLFLVPNPAWNEGAPDWNETNCAIAYIQLDTNGATLHFQYKVNENNNNMMYSKGNNGANNPYTNAPGSWDGVMPNYYETGDLGSVTNPLTALGTWTLKFTSDSNLTLIAPGGSSSSMVMPSYNASYFKETNPTNGFNLYVGMQPNNAAALNQAVVFGDCKILNVAAPYSENFLDEDSAGFSSEWRKSVASGPAGVLVLPQGAAYWMSWTLPDNGFQPVISSNATGFWYSPSGATTVPMTGIRAHLVLSNDLPAGNTAFFRAVKRVFTQLQILLPGETAAPNTPTGKTGTPTPISVVDYITVTVNAVDSGFNPIAGINDSVSLSSSDPYFYSDSGLALTNGTGAFSVQFGSLGTNTITVKDTTSSAIAAATSAGIVATYP